MATGYVSPLAGAADPATTVTDWEAAANVSDCKVVGGFGSDVADEISNGVVKFLVTATADTDITGQYSADDITTGVTFGTSPGEAAPA